MKSFEKIQELIKASFTSGEIFHADLRPEWGSSYDSHRMEIRKGILEYLKAHHPEEIKGSVWNLEAPPTLPHLFISISHCKGMGGFVICSQSIGLDVEEKSRLSVPLLERISSEEERRICPQLELLWTAKEAIFKCSNQFYTIEQIYIDN